MLYNYDRVADSYDRTRVTPPGALSAVADAIAGRLGGTTPAPRVLEVGIGTGRVALPLAQRGVEVIGVDISPRMLAGLLAKPGGALLGLCLAESAALPFADDSFEAVLFMHVLHLLPDPAASVAEAARILRPGGVVLAGDTRHQPSPMARFRPLLEDAIREVTGREHNAPRYTTDTSAAAAALVDAGLVAEREAIVASWTDLRTVRTELESVAARSNSNTWNIPPEALSRVITVLTPRAVAEVGELDDVVESVAEFRVAGWRRPR